MTRTEALAEAQRRWGPTAWVHRSRRGYVEVGRGTNPWTSDMDETTEKMGGGGVSHRWEDAFADADRRAK